MKKTLLTILSNLSNANPKKNLLSLLIVALFAFGLGQKSQAQCVEADYAFKVFESFPTSVANLALYTGGAAGNLIQGTSAGNYWTVSAAGVQATTVSNTGVRALGLTNTTASLITPQIANLEKFSFYYRASTLTTNGAGYNIAYSTSAAGPWTTIETKIFTTTTYTKVTYDLSGISGAPLNLGALYIRIIDARPATLSATTIIDDIGWRSTAPAENNMIIIPKIASSSCYLNLLASTTYTIYDSGGISDAYNNSQDNTINFIPPAGYDANLVINSITTNTPAATCSALTDWLEIRDGGPTGTIKYTLQSGCASSYVLNTTVVTSTACDGSLTTRFKTDAIAATATGVGFQGTITTTATTCPDVSGANIIAGSISEVGATISWSAPCATPAGGYDYYVSNILSSPLPPATVPLGNVSGTTAVVTGFTGGSTLYAWVRTRCSGSSTGAWVYAGTWDTLCPAIPVPPTYLENMNGLLSGFLPICTYTDSSNWKSNNTNGNLFAFQNVGGGAVAHTWYTKALTLVPGDVYRLSYDYSAILGTANATVSYGTTPYNPTATTPYNYVPDATITHTGVSSLNTNVVNFTATAGTYYAQFKLTGSSLPGTTQFNLDNVQIMKETCFPPTALSVIGMPTSNSAVITYTAPVTAPSGYQYYVSTVNSTPAYTVTVSGSTVATTQLLSGLTSSTTYYVWVRSNCSGLFSAWSQVLTFTTDVGAGSVTMSNGSSTSCNLNFFDSNSGGAYANNEVYTYTFYPSVAGQKIKVAFSTFATENNYDGLMIYDGPDTASPLISSGRPAGNDATTCPAGAYSGTTSPGIVYSSHGTGALTFVFRSDFIVTAAGWTASVSCVIRPTITGFTPTDNNCTTGTVVTITGTNFNTPGDPINTVTFNGVAAAFTVNSATQITATLPAGATTGIIVVSNINASGTSPTQFVVNAPRPPSTNNAVCTGITTGTISASSVNCNGFVVIGSGLSISGAWVTATDLQANRPNTMTNSPVCAFAAGTLRHYTARQFQVTVTGTYTFAMANTAAYDGMGYITSGAFTPGVCGGGIWIVGDDDSGANEPILTTTLTAGTTYTLYSTTWFATIDAAYTWNITPPLGGQIKLEGNGVIEWYANATGGTPLATGDNFNPVTQGNVNTNTPATTTFYAACSTNPTCRTATTFTLNGPVVNLTGGAICAGSVKQLTATGTATGYTWSSSVANTLYTDAAGSIPYSGASTPSVYLKTSTNNTIVTVTGAGSPCSNPVPVTFTFLTKTWNGSAWSGDTFAPTASESIVFNGNFSSTANLQGCSCIVNSGIVTINSPHNMTLAGNLNVAGGTMTFNSGATLLQTDTPLPANQNTGDIVYKRATSMRKFDYTYWSSPVNLQILSTFSPETLSDKYFWFRSDPPNYNWEQIAVPGLTPMDNAKGYIIRAPQNFDPAAAAPWTGSYVGVPNNGNYSVPVYYTSPTKYLNLIGNPYPSAISASSFMAGNTAAFGPTGTTLYFWTHNTALNFVTYAYDDLDYAAWNVTGSIAGSSPCTGCNNAAPTGNIAAGQGFMVKGVNSGTAVFTNAMRLPGSNTQFYRNSDNTTPSDDDDIERNRLWLEMRNNDGAYKQILVGYIQNASNQYDNGFDGDLVEAGNSISFYSVADNTKLVIQGRGLPFAESDQVALGFRVPVAANFEIRLSDFDGMFEGAPAVYIEDRLLNVCHNLKESPYSFVTEAGEFETRFVLRYNLPLNTNPFGLSENAVIAYKQQESIHIETANINMKSVQIYDVRGRLVMERNNINGHETVFENVGIASQVLVIQIESTDGIKISKKIIF
jgi:IPT/TIG domain-containing protein